MKFILSLLVFAMWGSPFAEAATYSATGLEPTDAQLVQSEFDKGAIMTFYCPGIANASCFSTLGTEIYAQMGLLMEKKMAKECGVSRRLGETAGLRGGAQRELVCPPACPDRANPLFCAMFCSRRGLKEEDNHAPDERNLMTGIFLEERPADKNNLLGLFGEFPGEFPTLELAHYECIASVGECSMEWLTC